jgi:galactokinase
VALIETAKHEGIAHEISAAYLRRTGIRASLFMSRPAAGASLIES